MKSERRSEAFIASCMRVHADLILLTLSVLAISHDEAKTKPQPESPPLLQCHYKTHTHTRKHTRTHTHRRARTHTIWDISSSGLMTLTYIVLLFTGDRVAADFSVLYRCQVPEKNQWSFHHFTLSTWWLSHTWTVLQGLTKHPFTEGRKNFVSYERRKNKV